MGTNFYWLEEARQGRRGMHIGKRSAAGLYCWGCRASLCPEGDDAVHAGGYNEQPWPKTCPTCGDKAPNNEPIELSAGMRELGFNTSAPTAPNKGMQSCSSFNWAATPHKTFWLLEEKAAAVVDEYGSVLTAGEFLAVLRSCPIQFYDNIGREFF